MSASTKRHLAIGWTLLIVAACSVPGTDLPQVDIEWIDKFAHFGLFAVLAWLWLDALSTPLGRRVILVVLLGSLFGVLTEFYQWILPWERTPDVLDAVSNSAGLVAGSGLFTAWRKLSPPKDGQPLDGARV